LLHFCIAIYLGMIYCYTPSPYLFSFDSIWSRSATQPPRTLILEKKSHLVQTYSNTWHKLTLISSTSSVNAEQIGTWQIKYIIESSEHLHPFLEHLVYLETRLNLARPKQHEKVRHHWMENAVIQIYTLYYKKYFQDLSSQHIFFCQINFIIIYLVEITSQ